MKSNRLTLIANRVFVNKPSTYLALRRLDRFPLTPLSLARRLMHSNSSYPPAFPTPAAMHAHIMGATRDLSEGECVRNFVGKVENMKDDELAVATPLFTKEALEFYTAHNMCAITPDTHPEEYKKWYNEARGGSQGDYREGLVEKINNVVDCLTNFPQSKRAVLTVPYASEGSMTADHTRDDQAKCLRELHFYIENDKLSCTGFMRAQAASIFPKNIHFIGKLMNTVAKQLDIGTGSYTHIVTTLVDLR